MKNIATIVACASLLSVNAFADYHPLITGFNIVGGTAVGVAASAGPTLKTDCVITINGETKTYKAGSPAPGLRAGDQVSVVSGDATFVLPGGNTVEANGAGSAFSVSPTAATLSVTSSGGNVSVSDSSGNTNTLTVGGSVNVAKADTVFANGSPATFSALTVQNTLQNSKNPPSSTVP